MGLRRELEARRLAPAADFLVVLLTGPARHAVVRQVGQSQEQVATLLLDRVERGLLLLDPIPEGLALRQQIVRRLTRLLRLGDLGAQRLALPARGLQIGDDRPALGVERLDSGELGLQVSGPLGELRLDLVEMILDLRWIQHDESFQIVYPGGRT